MRRLIKLLSRKILSPFGLEIVSLSPSRLTGTNLFSDLKKLVDSTSPTCVDVGANIGQTVSALSSVFNKPKIYAFEPAAESFAELKQRYGGANVTCFNLGLGNSPGVMQLNVLSNSCLNSLLNLDPSPENRFRRVEVKGRQEVLITTYDEFTRKHSIGRVDLLKIDTQGYDLKVLEGAANAFSNRMIDFVIVEINFVPMYEGQAPCEAIFCFLSKHGFVLIDLYEKVRQGFAIAWCTALFGRRDLAEKGD
jgi:FkbM family methyltransferase